MQHTILVIDDEKDIRTSLTGILEDEGYQVLTAESGMEGIDSARHELPDLILLDIWMPGIDGLKTLELLKQSLPQITVIMISGHGTIETAVRATKLGAFDFIEKPLSLEKVLITVANALQLQKLKVENAELKRSASAGTEIVGESAKMLSLKQKIKLVAANSAPVLITGENGSEKDLVACSIHCSSQRREHPFVTVHCSAIPAELIESELFGHEKGGVSAAVSNKKGRFDQADGGTIFLDDICELSLNIQLKLLNFIQNGYFERVGGIRKNRVDVRIIASTSVDVEKSIAVGRFSSDLYYQISMVTLKIPNLRERLEDIDLFVSYFSTQFSRREGGVPKKFTPETIEKLRFYSWPGNIRELKNVIERLLIVVQGETVTPEDIADLSLDISSSVESLDNAVSITAFREAKEKFEREFITRTLEENDWNISRSAELIDVELTTLQRKIKNYGIAVRR